MAKNIIPAQEKGTHNGASKSVTYDTREEALEALTIAKTRLLDINSWSKIAGTGSASFQLTDAQGNFIYDQVPQVGNLIRIDLPGPGNPSGEGYDWVRIEAFDEIQDVDKDQEIYGFRIRPTHNPIHPKEESAHFYTEDTTGSFLITRFENKVTAAEKGRNEVLNNDTDSFITNVRNTLVVFSAMLGFSVFQWQKFVDGLLQGPEEERHSVQSIAKPE